MNLLLTIFFLIVIISVVVFVHELGHFLTAKFFKMTVNEFSIGFGKKLFTKYYKGTSYSFRLIPLGGFVELEGEHSSQDPNSFRNRPFYQKTLVLVAGVTMNVILAVILLTIFLATNNYNFLAPKIIDYSFNNTISQESYSPISVASVLKGGRSEGILNSGEIIVAINNNAFTSFDNFSELLKENQDKEVTFTLINPDTNDTYSKSLRLGSQNKDGAILDVQLTPTNSQIYLIKYNKNITAGVSMTYDVFVYQVKAIGFLIGNSFKTGDYNELSQTVGGIPQVTDQIGLAVEANAFNYLLSLSGLVSISLAFFNILPFPALDGGQIVVAFLEKVRRKKFSDAVLNRVNLAGFALLIIFALLINLKDVIQLGWVGDFLNGIKSVLGK